MPIEALNQTFDPTQHEAVMQRPSSDHSEPTVLQVLAQGYRLGDRVLRPAKVIVSTEG
jgi:molecular chaperone GrpE